MIASKTNYEDGMKQGRAVWYYQNSDTIRREAVYRNDRINGQTLEYYPNGKLKRRMQIRDGLMHGKVETVAEDDGRLVKEAYCLSGESVTEAEFRQNGE
jgi:antitoxin component YwqK of YwqJK toxin-antitoxin module